jgi:hypothetical protein
VEAAYNKAKYIEPRRKMMQDWADYINDLRAATRIEVSDS